MKKVLPAVLLLVVILYAAASAATWKITQGQYGDPDEYECSRNIKPSGISYENLSSRLSLVPETRLECERKDENPSLKDIDKAKMGGRDGRFVINFSGSLFFLAR